MDAELMSQISSYRHLARGIAPPPAVWQGALHGAAPPPPSTATVESADVLLEDERTANAALVARLTMRQAEMRDVPTDLPPQVRVALAIERQLPGLLVQQRQLRAEMVGYADRSRLIDEAAASLSLRRARRTRQQREVREAERNEKKRAADEEQAQRGRRADFLTTLTAHAEEFRAFHREARRGAQRLGRAVLSDFDGKARKERRDGERERKERLKALKENNMEEYMKLVHDSKNERINQLLQETDKYLLELGTKVSQQKAEVRERSGGASGSADDAEMSTAELEAAVRNKEETTHEKYTEKSTYYRLAHTVESKIETQPKMLRGGQLKE